jgi:flap endonuclease-1
MNRGCLRVGFNLSPLLTRHQLTLDELRGKTLAIDANNNLYQFLALIRMRDGRPFTDSEGHVTSHLVGLLMRTTRLMADYHIRPVFVFDGKPPQLKMHTLELRRGYRDRARKEWESAVKRGDYSAAWSKAVTMNSLTQEMQNDAKKMLSLLGIPYVQAPQEGEAQAAFMAIRGDVWAANSRDYDSVLFGTPRLVRYMTISGQEFLPSKGVSRPLIPELIELQALLYSLRITREQLVDLAILVGTDFNKGIEGVGPKTALKLVQGYGRLEALPEKYKEQLPERLDEIRNIFLNPDITSEYTIRFGKLDEAGLHQFLSQERGFSNDRVELSVRRMRQFYSQEHSTLKAWLNES